LQYSSDDPIAAVRIKEAGAASVMPAGSPIGSGQGVLNRNNILLCLELLKQGDSSYPVIVDAGVGSASDVSLAMELGADGVLLNTAIAHATDPVMMAHAMRHGCTGGRQSYLAGRIPKKLYATASSPWEGTATSRVSDRHDERTSEHFHHLDDTMVSRGRLADDRLLASGLLVLHHFDSISMPGCGVRSACDLAAKSVYGKIGAFPVSWLGFCHFLALSVVWWTCRGAIGGF
jgi:hypothetical protein